MAGRQPPAEVISAAQASALRWGIPASVTLAQWAIESGWGEHEPPGSNNPFGIKALQGAPGVPSGTIEYIGGQARQVEQDFAVFPSVFEAFSAHARLLANPEGPYRASAAMLPLQPGDRTGLKAYVAAMGQVYATDPHYAINVWMLMIGNNLIAYDGGESTPATT